MESAFTRLTAYQAAVRLADDVYASVGKWRSLDQWSLGVQLLRAVDSIGANIAEAAGREHARDRRRFLVIARGSLYETEHWFRRAAKRGLTTADDDALSEVARTLSGLLKRSN
jgi:four helix bundle protein